MKLIGEFSHAIKWLYDLKDKHYVKVVFSSKELDNSPKRILILFIECFFSARFILLCKLKPVSINEFKINQRLRFIVSYILIRLILNNLNNWWYKLAKIIASKNMSSS